MKSGVKDCLKDVAKVVTRILFWESGESSEPILAGLASYKAAESPKEKKPAEGLASSAKLTHPHPIGLGGGATWTNRSPPTFATSTAISSTWCRTYHVTLKCIG